jgi:small subunit ribosomal protein S6
MSNVKRNYEVAIVFPAGKSDEEYKQLETKVGEWIELNGGAVNGSTHWGRRRLAYQIGLYREGYYVFLDADLETSGMSDIERRMNIDVDILRYLIIRDDEE